MNRGIDPKWNNEQVSAESTSRELATHDTTQNRDLTDSCLSYQEQSWNSGERCLVENLVLLFPLPLGPKATETLLALICNEKFLREAHGETPTLSEYQKRFPDLANDIKLQWEIDDLFASEDSDIPSSVEMPSRVRRIGRYEVLSELGRGAMGVVYLAWDPQLKRKIAIKRLRTGEDASSEEITRIRTEAEAVAQLQHPTIVQIYDVGEDDELPYLAMEYCSGGTLAKRLDGKPISPKLAAELLVKICGGVAAAHDRRIVHRDLKPKNVILEREEDWVPKVSDFGLAKLLDGNSTATATGNILGTPAYMAPEQAFGDAKRVGPAADIYSLGAILYECLTGRPPFLGVTIADTLEQVRQLEPVRVRQLEPQVPVDLEIIASRCLQKDASHRYATVVELIVDIENYLAGRPIRARPISFATHLVRWGKRNPIVAGLTTGILLLLCATIALQWFTSRQIKKEIQEKSLALNERADALNAKEFALQVAKENELLAEKRLYAAEMNLAEQAFTAGNPARAMDLLENQRPGLNSARPDFRGFEWHYLYGQLQQDLVTSFQPDYVPVTDAQFSSDGKYLAWYTIDVLLGNAWIVDLSAPNFEVHGLWENGEVGGIAFSPDGSTIAIASDQEVMFVELPSRRRKDSLKTNSKIKVLAWSPDGKWMALGGHDGSIRMQQLDGNKEHIDLPPHQLSILSLNFTNDSKQVYATSGYAPNDVLTRQYNFTESPLAEPKELKGVSVFDLSADGKQLAGLNWGVIKIVDAVNHDMLWEEQLTSGTIGCVRFSIDGDRVIRGGLGDRLAEIWNWKDKKLLKRVAHNAAVRAVSFDRQDKYWVTASDDGVVKLWSTLGEKSKDDWTHTPPIRQMDVVDDKVYVGGDFHFEILSEDSTQNGIKNSFKYLYELSTDGKVALVLRPTPRPDGSNEEFEFTPDHPPPGLPETIEIWDVGSPNPRLSFQLPDHKERAWRAAAFSSSGSLLATRQWDSFVRIWRVSGTLPKEMFAIDDVNCLNLRFSKDEKYLAACCEGSCVKVIELDSGKVLPSFQLSSISQQWTITAEFSADSRYLAAGNAAGVVQVWDVQSQQRVATLRGHLGETHSLAFFPNSEILAVGGVGPITIWNLTTGQQLMTIATPDYKIEQIAIADNGMTLYGRSDNGVVRRWKVKEID